MMNKKQPEIRFPGFDGDWKQYELGEMLEERNEQIIESDEYPLMSFVQGVGVTPKGERYDRSFLVKDDKKKYKKTELGDFIYSSNNLETGSIGFNKTGKAVISPVYSIFSSKTKLESQFIGIMSTRKDFINKMIHYRQGVVYGQWRIHEKDFLNIKVNIPVEKEQKEIIEFFKQLDDTIDLHQQKLINLKQTKQVFLQKMFPEEGKKVPEIRFPGFTDTWELRKLEDISDKIIEKNKENNFTETLTNSAEYGIINQREFFDKDISNEKNLNGYYIVRQDDFVYNPRISNYAPVGPIKRNKLGRTGVMSPLYYVFRTYDVDKNFLEYYFDTTIWHKFMKLNGDSGARADRFAIKDSTFKELPIPYPSLTEQKRIGVFLDKLTSTIALHQRELDLLQETKKAFLQKMFI
ncbi:restriction endonuclease subunit S [Enterococcus crotali]|uniref:restriction endonuclease subunit S n=1 Tax=Enterococcus crotali TaxID=1453587 RepID=UPI0004716113|nr:restriction endonuclease subunit S [Enterococcus crotali]